MSKSIVSTESTLILASTTVIIIAIVTFLLQSTSLSSLHWAYVCIGNLWTLFSYILDCLEGYWESVVLFGQFQSPASRYFT